MDVATELDIVVSVDAHNLLDDVGLTGHVDTIAGYTQLPSVFLTGDDLDLEALEDTCSLVSGDELTDECIHMAGAQRHFVGLSWHGIVVEAATIDIATGAKLEDERSSTHQRPGRAVGIQPTLEAEGGVRIHSQTACGLAHGGRVEVRRLEEDIRRRLRRTRVQTTHDASDAEGLTRSRSDDEITLGELTLTLVEEDHLLLSCQLHREGTACLRQVIGVEGLTEFVEDVVRHVDDYVDGA